MKQAKLIPNLAQAKWYQCFHKMDNSKLQVAELIQNLELEQLARQEKSTLLHKIREGFWRDTADVPSQKVTAVLKARKSQYLVKQVVEGNKVHTRKKGILKAFSSYYSKLYASINTSRHEHLLLLKNWKVNPVWQWSHAISKEEVFEIVETLNVHKAPGPDGISYGLFKTHSRALSG